MLHWRRATDSDATPIRLVANQIRKSLISFKKGSAPGPSGLRPEHLKAATKFGSPTAEEKVVNALLRLGNVALEGKVPSSIAQYFYGARLHGAIKKDGGLRSIAVGEVLIRLFSKCAL